MTDARRTHARQPGRTWSYCAFATNPDRAGSTIWNHGSCLVCGAARDAGRRARDGVAGKNRVARPLLCRQRQRRGRSHGNQERGAGEHVHGVDPHLIRSQRGLRVVIPGRRWSGAIPASQAMCQSAIKKSHAMIRTPAAIPRRAVRVRGHRGGRTGGRHSPVKATHGRSPPIACSSRGGLCSSRLAPVRRTYDANRPCDSP